MGLRMFTEPEAATPKPTGKPDPTASARSSIRRQRTVRYSPNVRDHQSTLNHLLSSNRSHSQGRMRMLASRRSLLEDIRRRDRRTTLSTSGPHQVSEMEAEAEHAPSDAILQSRIDGGRALLRDALSYERPGHHAWIAREEGPIRDHRIQHRSSTRRPGDIDNLHAFSRPVPTRSPPSGYVPNAPYNLGNPAPPISQATGTMTLGTASFTPGFAPAHRLDLQDGAEANLERAEVLARLSARLDELSEREYVAGHRAEINRMRSRNPTDLTIEYREAEAAYLESVETRLDVMRQTPDRDSIELPPLQRMGRLYRRYARSLPNQSQGSLDGLGDRQRSLSPGDDQWETMLTTIQPDDRVPSTNSSFTSTSDSSTSLSSNPVSSYGTLVTAASTASDLEACPVDFSDSDDSFNVSDAQLSPTEAQAHRIDSLSQRVNRQRYREESNARRRRIIEREEELRELEANLRRLERQFDEEYPVAAGRHRRDGYRAGRERL